MYFFIYLFFYLIFFLSFIFSKCTCVRTLKINNNQNFKKDCEKDNFENHKKVKKEKNGQNDNKTF